MTTATITNLTRGVRLADPAWVPTTPSEKRMGLLGHLQLLPGEGMLILDCDRIHTVGMQFPIDVCFFEASGRVVLVGSFQPGETIIRAKGAAHVLELPVGMLEATETRPGDYIQSNPIVSVRFITAQQ